jgi:hypothetical protein
MSAIRHLATGPAGAPGRRTVCGRLLGPAGWVETDPDLVTCYRCQRTAAWKLAAARQSAAARPVTGITPQPRNLT